MDDILAQLERAYLSELRALVKTAVPQGQYDESKHKRDPGGRFGSKPPQPGQQNDQGGVQGGQTWQQVRKPAIDTLRHALLDSMSRSQVRDAIHEMRLNYHKTGELTFPKSMERAVLSSTTPEEWAGLKRLLQDAFAERLQPQPQQPKPMTKGRYVIKQSDPEKRYTLGPFYIPGKLDAHNEFATSEDLQEAVWGYVRKGYRDIHLQHSDKRAGEWVEVVSWPYETSVMLTVPGEVSKAQTTLPAGTVYMGVVWDPWAWDLVKDGKLRGLSMGGYASRMEVDFDQELHKAEAPKKAEDPKKPPVDAEAPPAEEDALGTALGLPPGATDDEVGQALGILPDASQDLAAPPPTPMPPPVNPEVERDKRREEAAAERQKEVWTGIKGAWSRLGMKKAKSLSEGTLTGLLDEKQVEFLQRDAKRFLDAGPTPGRMLEVAQLVDEELDAKQQRALLALDGDEAFDLLVLGAVEMFGADVVGEAITEGPEEEADEFETVGDDVGTADEPTSLSVSKAYSEAQHPRGDDGQWVSAGALAAIGTKGRIEYGAAMPGPEADTSRPLPRETRDEHFDVEAAKGSVDRKLGMGGFHATGDGTYANEFGETVEVKDGQAEVSMQGAHQPSLIVTEKDPRGEVTRSSKFFSKKDLNASRLFERMAIEQAMRDEVGMPSFIKAYRWVADKVRGGGNPLGKEFNPNQPRDSEGKWTRTPGGGSFKVNLHINGLPRDATNALVSYTVQAPTASDAARIAQQRGQREHGVTRAPTILSSTEVEPSYTDAARWAGFTERSAGGFSVVGSAAPAVRAAYARPDPIESKSELAAHLQHVTDVMEGVLAEHDSTDYRFEHNPAAPGLYQFDRANMHADYVAEEMQRAKGVPNEKVAIIMGGLPGAGKTTFLNGDDAKRMGIDPTQYMTVNPDDAKQWLAEGGHIPTYDDLSPMECAPALHEESSDMAKDLMKTAMEEGKNLIYDFTLSSPDSGRKKMTQLRNAGYKVRLVYVDTDPRISLDRAVGRYERGRDSDVGGRVAQWDLLRSMKPDSQGRTQNKAAFDELHNEADGWALVDNNDGPYLMGSGGSLAAE